MEEIIKAKTEGYYAEEKSNNFVIDNELTVEITLKEYRDLIKAEAALRESHRKDVERLEESIELKKMEIDRLKAKIESLIYGEEESEE